MRIKRVSLFFAAVALCVPLAIFSFSGTDLPLSDLVCLVGIVFSLRYAKYMYTQALYLAILMSLLASLVIAFTVKQDFDMRTIYSIVYFFKPYFAIFVAFRLIRNNADFETFIRVAAHIIFFVTVQIVVSIILNSHGLVRNESDLNGEIFGQPLYGTFGVNSLAVYYLLLYFIVLFSKYVSVPSGAYYRAMRLITLVLLTYLILGSLSREAILGYFALLLWYVYSDKVSYWQKAVLTCIIVGGFVFAFSLESTTEMLASKTTQIVEGIEEGDFDKITSGRLGLQSVAIEQLSHNIFFGNGFHGFQLYTQDIIGFETVEGLSPHNQLITTFWKMGALASIPYFLSLILLFKMLRLIKGTDRYIFLRAFLSVVFFVLATVWDVLIIPNFAALLFFLWGGMINSAFVVPGEHNHA
jgi:hypothetical protein